MPPFPAQFIIFPSVLGGTIDLGIHLSKKDLENLRSKGHVVNCLGRVTSLVSLYTSCWVCGDVRVFARAANDPSVFTITEKALFESTY